MRGEEIRDGPAAASARRSGPCRRDAGSPGARRDASAYEIPTGLPVVDDLLGGGIRPGMIVDVFGGYGTGKTQLLLQVASAFAGAGRRVLYVDTVGKFRPERLVEMAGTDARVLDRIALVSIRSVAAQIAAVDDPRSGEFDLIVVDSVTDLFSYEYSRYGSLLERNQLFFDYMRSLARLAVRGRASVLVSNMIRTASDVEVENMAAEISHFAHLKMHLAREDGAHAKKRFRGRASCAFSPAADAQGLAGHDREFAYVILASGLRPAAS